ncbi:MAG: hypothetical protein R6U57_05485 [Anaerolineales bacterium]
MKGKGRLWTILALAGFHALLTYLVFLRAFPLGMSLMDGDEALTWVEEVIVEAAVILLYPYYPFLLLTLGLLPRSPVFHTVMLGVNSLLWGVALDAVLRLLWRWFRPGPSPSPE